MKTNELPAFPIVLFVPSSRQFVSYDETGEIGHELADRPEEATIFPMWGKSQSQIEDCKEGVIAVIKEIQESEEFEDVGEIIPLHAEVKVEIPVA